MQFYAYIIFLTYKESKQESMKHEYDYFRCNRVVLNNIFKINQIDDLPSTGWVVVGSWDHLVGQGHCRGHAVEHLVQPSEHVLVVSKQSLLGRKNIFIH